MKTRRLPARFRFYPGRAWLTFEPNGVIYRLVR
jgi:hypothetical protein